MGDAWEEFMRFDKDGNRCCDATCCGGSHCCLNCCKDMEAEADAVEEFKEDVAEVIEEVVNVIEAAFEDFWRQDEDGNMCCSAGCCYDGYPGCPCSLPDCCVRDVEDIVKELKGNSNSMN